MSLATAVRTIQDIMRKDAGVDGDAQRISQLGWMLFLKIFDDYERERELLEQEYRSPIPESLRWCNWGSSSTGLLGDGLINFVNSELFTGLRNLPLSEHDPRCQIIRTIFQGIHNYMKSGVLMRQVIDRCNEIDFRSSKDRHIFGDVYEQILSGLQNAGNAGEFYTSRALTKFMVEIIDPRLGERILDPACGTGGFLISAIEHICKNYVKNDEDEKILHKSIEGIDKKSLPFLLCITNMILHGIETPAGIRNTNALARQLSSYDSNDQVDVIVTNPPFGGMEEDGIELNFPENLRSHETADLFLVLIIRLLKDGGRAAIILPDGALRGENNKLRIRKALLEECNLHTIIRLPSGVFNPYTSIKTNLLFFVKGEPTREIWYYEHPYPPGIKSYSKTKPIRFTEFKSEKEWWNNRRQNRYAWKVSVTAIKNNAYNLDIQNPYVSVPEYENPQKLMTQYQRELSEIGRTLSMIHNQLMWQQLVSQQIDSSINMLFEQPGLLVSNPTNIQKLSEIILKLAIGGQLGTQNSKDKSARMLLKRIKAEKDRIIGDGRLKGARPLPVSDTNDIKHKLPDGWMWARLGEIGQIVGGGTPKTDHPEYFSDSGIPWITPADLYRFKGKLIIRGKRDISELGLRHSSAQLMPAGAVLFSSRAPIGYVAIAANPATTSQGFKSCVPFISEMSDYIYYFLKSAAKEIEEQASGTTFKEISGKEMSNTLVPIPPLEEQRRIILKLDQLMSLCNELESKVEQIREIGNRLVGAIQQVVLTVK